MKYPRYVFRVGGLIIRNLFWIHNWARHLDKHPLEERYQRLRKLVMKVNKGLSMEFHVQGLENIPMTDDSFLIIPNHQSMIDPLVLIPYFEKPISFIAKKETKKSHVIDNVMRIVEGVYIDRDNLRQELKVIRHVINALGTNRMSWTVFAEGSRSKHEDHHMNELKAGTFKIAMDSHKMILPVAIYGSFRVLPTKYKNKINPIQVHILKPIPYEEYATKKSFEIAKMVEDRLREEVEAMRLLDEEYMQEIAMRKKRKKTKKAK